MADRSDVSLYILLTQVEQAKPLFHKAADYEDLEAEGPNKHLAFFGFDGINYGNLDCLHELQRNGIAYNSTWGRGSEYDGGTRYARFTPEGDLVIKEIFESEDGMISLSSLEEFINDHHVLKNLILAQKELAVLPWDNQIEYGKLYRAKCLITTPEFK